MTDCPKPDCVGFIEDDYCNRCGHRHVLAPAHSLPTVGPSRSVSRGHLSVRGSSGPVWPSSHRGEFDAGLITLPPVSAEDPTAAVLDEPEVSERRRFCADPDCNAPVGRSKNGRPGRVHGFCPQCGREFSFSPLLAPGDLVAAQYEVRGALAHGGLGWIYLARDNQVPQWVVLKGLRDPDVPTGRQAAAAELEALADANHPNIVAVYNRVKHPHPRTGKPIDYIVMEYVGGRSLKQLYQEQWKLGGGLSLAQVCGCILEVLPALGHLHSRGLLYCDFKPHNVIVSPDRVRLVDLGAVRHVDDKDSPIWGTPGFQDPAISRHGPSIATDLYAVARTMAVLSFEFPGFSQEYQATLPSPDEVEVLARHESYYRLLRRATNPDASRRFASAAEMADQLEAVLREVLAREDGAPRPAVSTLFGPELAVVGADPATFLTGDGDTVAAALALPDRQADPDDPQAGLLTAVGTMRPEETLRALSEIPHQSIETRLRAARTRIELGELDTVRADVQKLESEQPGDWRVSWCRALAALVSGELDEAREGFDAVLDAFPGEAAPKLALALCAEHRSDHETAVHYYDIVWQTDRSYLSAAFGLARARFALGDRAGMTSALESVPESARYGVTARLCAILGRSRARTEGDPLVADFFEAAERLSTLGLEAERRGRAVVEVLETALAWQLAGRPWPADSPPRIPPTLLGYELTERGLRGGLEKTYLELARLAPAAMEGITLVDKANAVRARSWI
ncbi:MAG: tetratricopeptide repeat protein [Pseudonocardiaceae bacterium]